MWKIENLESPFVMVTRNMLNSWLQLAIKGMKLPYALLSEKLTEVVENTCLNPIEIFDVETSWQEIKCGKAKRYASVEELLKDLKS